VTQQTPDAGPTPSPAGAPGPGGAPDADGAGSIDGTDATATAAARLAEPALSGVRNFRDLGGLPAGDGRRVRAGRLFRSGHLAHSTAEDTRFIASLGLRTVVDFRNAADITLEGPDVALPGVRNVNVPLSDPADGAEFWKAVRHARPDELRPLLGGGRAAERMRLAYRAFVLDRVADHARLLGGLADDGDGTLPVLMHCSAGKDRAGTAIAIVLLALGVRRDAIEADYVESNAPHRRYRVRRADGAVPAVDPEVAELLAPLFDARVEYLRAAFGAMEEGWGSVDGYLADGLGLTAARRERLRAALLE
jgi:protein-tyrosine phosphatase